MGYWLPAKKKEPYSRSRESHEPADATKAKPDISSYYQTVPAFKKGKAWGVGNVNETAEPVFPEAGSIIDPAAVPRLPFSS